MSLSYNDYAKEKGIKVPKTSKKPGGLGGILAGLLPTGGGVGGALGGAALGASVGSVVPVIGTGIGGLLGAVLGGAAGSAAGKVGENAIEGEKDLGEGVAGEALLGGLTSTPITGGLKLLKGAGKAALGVEGALKKGAQEAGASAIPKAASGLRAKAGEELLSDTSKPGILSRVQRAAQRTDAEVSGIGAGKALNGKTITPKRSQELYSFARDKGISTGTPHEQAQAAQNLFDQTTSSLDETLNSINRKLQPTEIQGITKGIQSEMKAAKGTGKALNVDTSKFLKDIGSAKDIKTLEKIRREADDLAFTARGAGKTAAAKQAQVIRNAVDKFVTGLDENYKLVKGDYRNAKDLLELMSKNASAPKGGLNILGNRVGAQSLTGAVSKGSGLLARANKDAAAKAADTVRGQGVLGTVARESLLGSRPDLTGEQPDQTTDMGLTPELQAGLGNEQNPQVDQQAQLQQGLQAAALKALAAGDSKGLDNIIQVASLLQSLQPAQAKPMSAEAAKVTSNAQSGLDSLSQLESELQNDPSIQGKSAISSVVNPFGITGNLLGTGGYEANRQNIIDVIARLRTGAAITNDEAGRFAQLIPQPADSQEVAAQKINMLRNQFSEVLGRTGSAGTDTQSLIGA